MDNGKGKFGGREVVIVEAVRTPIGRGHPEKGYYKDVHPSTLLARTFEELIKRAGIDPAEVEDVIGGCVQQFGEQTFNITRNAWLQAGLPIETPATTVDRQCGSGQQAVNLAASLIASGVHDVVAAGGVEHMGHNSFATGLKVQEEYGYAFTPELMERYNLIPQGLSAEMIADQWEIPRSELDEIGLRSQQLAQQATEEGRFEREIMPFAVNGDTYTTDQGLRETTLEGLAGLKPAFKEDGKITAGNSSQVSDGAAALLLMTREKAEALGLTPRARLFDQTTVGVDRCHFEVQRGDPLYPKMARHLLVLEGLARVLAVTRRTQRAMADRHAVAGLKAGEVPALHATGEALALGGAADIDLLAGAEMRGGQGRTWLQQRIRGNPEFHQLLLRLNLRFCVVASLRLRNVLHLRLAQTDLDSRIAILLFRALGDDLHLVQVQHGDRHMGAVILEYPGHTKLLGQETGA